MRINKINYKAYGKLRNKEIVLDSGVNLIYGENEAGKSTVFSSILTFLYGISPQSKERHPYVNWETNDLDFSVTFEMGQGQYLMNRKLLSVPKTTLTNLTQNSTETSRNDTLNVTSNISEALYTSVFHITSDHLSNIEDETWESIQENLIFNYGMDYLRKSSDIVFELEREINTIWRKDRRGNPLINQKEAEIRDLMKQRVELEARYDEISKLNIQVEHLDEKLTRTELQKVEAELEYREIQNLLPIKEKIEKINFLKNQLVNFEWHDVIEENAYNMCTMLKKDVFELESEILVLENESAILESTRIDFQEEEQLILENADQIQYGKNHLNKLDQLEGQLQLLLTELSKKSDLIHYQFQMLFDVPYQVEYESKLLVLNPLEIKTELYKYLEISKRPVSQIADKKRILDYVFLGTGIVLLGGFFIFPNVIALGLLGTAILGFALSRVMSSNKVNGTIHDFEPIRLNLISLFEPMILPEYVWQDTSLAFISKLEQLLGLLFERSQIESHIRTVKDEINQIECTLRDSFSFVSLEQSNNIKLSVHMINLKLEKLREESKKQEALIYEINEIGKRVQALKTKKQSKADRLSELEMNFLNLGLGDIEQGFKNYHENNEILKRIKVFEEELSFSKEQVELYAQYESKTLISPMYLEELNKVISELSKEVQTVSIQKNNLEKDISILKEKMQMDELESQLLLLKEEVENLVEKRNRLMVLNEVVKYADEKFRRENQPDVLQRVSDYMRRMTSGKYKEVLISEQDGKFELQFLIDSEIYPISKAFSKGTIHQLFLAFRLAVIDHLNSSSEKLPLVLDEVFTNWDHKRMDATRQIIEEIAKERQVIMLTCHKHQLTHFENANIINLN